MFIDHLNLNHLRIFEAVYRLRSMTLASAELHLTQSGVSQHIGALEDALGVRLFDRIKQRLIPTGAANELQEECSRSFGGLERVVARIRGADHKLSGSVAIGMPVEFGNNVVIPLLREFARQHPEVTFALRFGFVSQMNDSLLNGSLDFAFVDSFGADRQVHTERVYDERLDLCATRDFLKKFGKGADESRKYFESLEYVDYLPGEPVVRMWFKHHFKQKQASLRVRATVMDTQGVARLVLEGMGAGVLPGHLISKLKKEGRALHVFEGSGKALHNAVSVANLQGRTMSPAASSVREWLIGSLSKEPSS